jgi:hypothetical protein
MMALVDAPWNPTGVPLALAAEILQIYPQREAALLSVNLEEKLKAKPYRFRGADLTT